jgi:hypothetical protein
VILTALDVDSSELEARTGWAIKSEGACKGDVCVPLPPGASTGTAVDARQLADRLGMPLVRDDSYDVWALGPDTGVTGRALTTAVAPELVLPDLRNDKSFALSSLRGQKVLLVAWASW